MSVRWNSGDCWCEELAQVGGTGLCLDGTNGQLLKGGRPSYVKHDVGVAGYEPASGDEIVV